MLDFGNQEITDEVLFAIGDRIRQGRLNTVDVILFSKDNLAKIIRYKK